MPVGTYNATDMVELKRERLFKVSTQDGLCTRKITVFDNFFHKFTKRITSESDTAGKMGPTRCPTIRSTGINPQLVWRWVIPLGIRHWQSCSFGFFRSFYASLKSKRQRAFLDFGDRYAHQIFGTNVNFGGGYENATTFWLGFRNRWPDPSSETVRFCGKLIKFSAFFHFSQHWMGVFTCGFHHYALFLL